MTDQCISVDGLANGAHQQSMTEKWKLELVRSTRKIAETLPKLTEELRRFNNQNEERSNREDRTEIDSADSPHSPNN